MKDYLGHLCKITLNPLFVISLMLFIPNLYAEDNSRIDKLEQEVELLKDELAAEDWTDKFSINGFASVGVGQSDNDAGYLDYDEDYDFKPDSVLGIQMGFNISERSQATVQLVGSADDNWDPEFEWAFISHQFTDAMTVRGGKLRLPLYMLSDYLEVGYSYPFARPSEEVYGAPVSSFTGVDMLYAIEMDSFTWTIQPFLGEASFGSVDITELYGLINAFEFDLITLRALYTETKVRAPTVPLIDGEGISFGALGFSYDNSELLVMAEYTQTKIDGLAADTRAGYVAIAYRFNEFQPYLMISRISSSDDDKRREIPIMFNTENIERTGYSLGVRWDFSENLAVKFDATYADDLDDTYGGFTGNEGVFQHPLTGEVLASNTMEFGDSTVISVVFDVIF